MLSRKIPRSF